MAPSGTREIAFTVRGPLRRSDLPGLCARICRLLDAARHCDRAGDTAEVLITCSCEDVEADLVAVEALATLQVAARRAGCRIRLRASPQLRALVDLIGLTDVLPS